MSMPCRSWRRSRPGRPDICGPAETAAAANEELPPRYWRYARLWERLGYPAFVAMLAIYFLMVLKPEILA
jgi:uncharacterized membrane protein